MKKDRHKKRRKAGIGWIVLFVLVICGVVAYKRVMLEQDERKVEEAYQAALKQYEKQEAREEELDNLEIYIQTKKFIEDMAREKFGLVYENEIIFQPESD